MKDTLFAIGEALIDFIPDKTGCDFSEITSFCPKLGGAPANVLGAFSKLGGKTELLTQLGDDCFGRMIEKELKQYSIGTKYVRFTDDANTALAFVTLDEKGNRNFSFYRNPSADMLYSPENITEDMLSNCFALHFCSVSLCDAPIKAAHKKVIEYSKKQGTIISFDPNLRFSLWKDKAALKNAVDEFLPYADIVKVSDNELSFITGTEDIEEASEKLLQTAKIVLCTCGSKGAYGCTKAVKAFSPSLDVKAIDTTGAGDAFCGSFLFNIFKSGYSTDSISSLSESELCEILDLSNSYCAKCVQGYGAIPSYPDAF